MKRGIILIALSLILAMSLWASGGAEEAEPLNVYANSIDANTGEPGAALLLGYAPLLDCLALLNTTYLWYHREEEMGVKWEAAPAQFYIRTDPHWFRICSFHYEDALGGWVRTDYYFADTQYDTFEEVTYSTRCYIIKKLLERQFVILDVRTKAMSEAYLKLLMESAE